MLNIKKLYFDLRQGYSHFGAILGISNFVMISYGLTVIKEYIPFRYFVVIVFLGMAFLLVIIGMTFRKKQMSTDLDQGFLRASEASKTTRILFDDIFEIKKALNLQISQESLDRRNLLKNIEDQNFD
ncbi:MAG TPA: hypothetical protein VLE02_05105 [Nitrosarchaeum sp.]|nr:hypothetical protein [Nitrosarchaeum sp.]